MKYQDAVYVGAPLALGLDPNFNMKGYRVLPILAAGATVADVIAAYSPLVMRMQRNSQTRAISSIPPGVTDDVPVNAPDWIRSPGFNQLTIQGGLVGVTYRVFWAEDCFEIVDAASPPYLPGFSGAAALLPVPVQDAIGPAGALTQAQNSGAANKPSLATDGLLIPAGASTAQVAISAAAANVLSPPADGLVWWRFNAKLGEWGETTLVESFTSGAKVAAGLDQLGIARQAGDRLYVEARNCPTSAGGLLTVVLTIS